MRPTYASLLSLITLLVLSGPTLACSRVVLNDVGSDVVVGRNMDWFEPMKTKMWILPRGMERNGEAGPNSLKWTSKYGSVIASVYDGATADGMNEKGLTASILYLSESDFGKHDPRLPGLSLSMWVQYFLDNFQTVNEALENMKNHPYQLHMAEVGNKEKSKATVHLAMTDKTGDTAVIEYIDGKPQIFHSKNDTVMTNSPIYADQLKNLKNYTGFGGTKPLPGTTQPADRFVRAAYYLKTLPKPKDEREAVAGVLSVMRNVSQPFGVLDATRPDNSHTLWRTVADLTKLTYFYESTLSPNIIWVDLNQINFEKDKSPSVLDLPIQKDYIGNVTKQFQNAPMFKFIPATMSQ